MPRPLFLPVLILLVAAGCTPRGEDASFTVTDSGDVTIAANRIDPGTLPEWTLPPQPALDLGTVDGPPEYQFYRAMDGLRLDDGRIVVANAGSQQLRFYDARGRYLGAQGREGDGPGEYRAPFRLMRLPGDSLLVYDLGLVRFTVIDPEGEVARVFKPARVFLNQPMVAGLIGDSVAATHELIFRIPQTGFDTVYTRVAFVRLDGSGSDSLMVPDQRMGHIGPGDHGYVGSPHFEPEAAFDADFEGLWVGTAREAEIVHYDAAGRVTRRVRWDAPAAPVTSEDVSHRIETILERAGERAAEQRGWWRDLPAADILPFYDALYVDRERRLWVRGYDVTQEAETRSWLVFDPEGRLLARAKLPARLRILEIGPGYLLAVQPDEMDVEHVRMWAVEEWEG